MAAADVLLLGVADGVLLLVGAVAVLHCGVVMDVHSHGIVAVADFALLEMV